MNLLEVLFVVWEDDFNHIRLLLVYKLIIKTLASTNITIKSLARLFVLSKEYKNMCSSVGLSSDIYNIVSAFKFKVFLYNCLKA